MATSTITLYTTDLTPKKNAWVDDIETYLSSCTKTTISNFQFIKHDLDLEIKVDFSQTYVDNPVYNYVKIVSNGVTRYYFVLDTEWRASKTVKYILSMDTVNSFQDKLASTYWSEKTHIIRQHKDRFYQPDEYEPTTDNSLYRRISKTNEGIDVPLMYKQSDTKLYDNDLKWYLVYSSDSNNAVNVYIIPSKNTVFDIWYRGTLYASNVRSAEGFEYWAVPNDSTMINVGTLTMHLANGQTVTYSSVAGKIFYLFKDGNYLSFRQYVTASNKTVVLSYDKIISIDFSATNTYFNFGTDIYVSDTLSRTSSDTDWSPVNGLTNRFDAFPRSTIPASYTIINGISAVNNTLSSISKIIELPYLPLPCTYENGHYNRPFGYVAFGSNTDIGLSSNFNFMRLLDKNTEFFNDLGETALNNLLIGIPNYENRFGTSSSTFYESKLYNSSFYDCRFVYDSFTYSLPYENINIDSNETDCQNLTINFKASNNLSSTILFDFQPQYGLIETNNFDHYLIANRNNQATVYSNDYINYIRTGYNYDVKAKNQVLATNILSSGIGIAGSIAGFAVGGTVGAATGISMAQSAINSAVGIISNYVAADRAIAQKKAELKAQAANIDSSDDLQLFNYYNDGNKLRLMIYEPSDELQSSIYSLFKLCGYAENSNGIPDFDSRRNYNYVQAEIVLTNESDPEFKDYLDDIKARYQAGVTYYHRARKSPSTSSSSWDFNQTYENWETWICPR